MQQFNLVWISPILNPCVSALKSFKVPFILKSSLKIKPWEVSAHMSEWGLRRPYPVPGRCWDQRILISRDLDVLKSPLEQCSFDLSSWVLNGGNLWDLSMSRPGGLGSSSHYTPMKNFSIWRDFVPFKWLRSSVGARPGTGCDWWIRVFHLLSQRTELPSPCWTSWSAVTWLTPQIRWRCCRGTPHHPSTLWSLSRSCACKCLLGCARASLHGAAKPWDQIC